MKVWTKLQSRQRAEKQGLSDPLQCIHCKIGYFIIMFPKNGGNFIACSWCHARIEDEDYENLIMIREALREVPK